MNSQAVEIYQRGCSGKWVCSKFMIPSKMDGVYFTSSRDKGMPCSYPYPCYMEEHRILVVLAGFVAPTSSCLQPTITLHHGYNIDMSTRRANCLKARTVPCITSSRRAYSSIFLIHRLCGATSERLGFPFIPGRWTHVNASSNDVKESHVWMTELSIEEHVFLWSWSCICSPSAC